MSTTNTTTEIELVQRRIIPDDSSHDLNGNDAARGGTTLATFRDQQSNILPHKKLMIVFPTIALAQMISYLDQTSVSTALPAIGSALHIGPSISWVATSFLSACEYECAAHQWKAERYLWPKTASSDLYVHIGDW